MFYKELNAWDIKREFEEMNRDYFSIDAIQALMELTDDEQVELDVIAICCEFTEYSEDDLLTDYGYLVEDENYQDEEEKLEGLLEELENHTTLYHLDNGNYLVLQF